MSFFKKFAWSGVAVVLAAVLALGLLSQSALAANEAAGAVTITRASDGAQTATTYTVTFTNGTVGGANNTILVGGDTITVDFTGAGAATAIRMTGASVFTPLAGFVGTGCASSTVGAGADAGVAVITLGAPCTVANDAIGVQFTLSNITNGDVAAAASLGGVSTNGATDDVTLSAATNTVATTAAAATGTTCTAGTLCVDALVLVPAGTTCNQAAINAGSRPGTAVADGSAALSICVHVSNPSTNSIDAPATFADANDTPVNGAVVNITTSLGVVSTGTAKSTTVITNPTGYATTNYRGGGNVIATDTITASVQGGTSAVGTLTVNLTAASGTTAAKLTVLAPSVLAIGANVTNTSPQYSSPTIGADVAVHVVDASGLGVNNQVVLVSVDKGFVIADAAFVSGSANANCAAATSKSVSLTTAATNRLSRGGQLTAGTVNFTVCANQLDAPGKITVTASNVSTAMANATTSISMAGRPGKVSATATGNAITATVTDKDGNNVADGTPVRFTISSNAGAVSVANGCTTTTNGQASAVVSLNQASGSVIVSADWNEGGTTATAATCATAGSQQLATSVTVPGGTSSAGGTTTPGAGSISSGAVPAAGGFGLIVASGDIKGVVTASGCPSATAAFWATVAGNFLTYVPGTTISAVNADFLAAFKDGILPAATPLIGKCK